MTRVGTTAAIVALVFASAAESASALPKMPPVKPPYGELRLRFLGRPSGGAAIWLTTGDDEEPDNHRYEGQHLLIDPGTVEDVEALLPLLGKAEPAFVLLTVADDASRAGAERLRRAFKRIKIVSATDTRAALTLGLELSMKLVPAGPSAVGIRIRYFDRVFAILPPSIALEAIDALRKELEELDLHVTLAHVTQGADFSAAALERLDPEAVVGVVGSSGAVGFPLPAPETILEIRTNGTELEDGVRFRSGHHHWIERTPTGVAMPLPASGPMVVTVQALGRDALFLVDSRSPFSYITRSWGDTLPPARAHGKISLQSTPRIPRATLGSPETGAIVIHRWNLHPIDDFALPDGRKIDGVLGFDILESIRIEMRPRDATMTWFWSGLSKTGSVEPAISEPGAKRTFAVMPLSLSARGATLPVELRRIPRLAEIGLSSESTPSISARSNGPLASSPTHRRRRATRSTFRRMPRRRAGDRWS